MSEYLFELDNQKENIADELVNSLRVITEYLNFSVNILPGIFELPANTSIILLPTLEIIGTKLILVILVIDSLYTVLTVSIKCNSDNRVIFNQSYNLGGSQLSNSLMFLFFMP